MTGWGPKIACVVSEPSSSSALARLNDSQWVHRAGRPWQSAEDYSPESVDSGDLPRRRSCALFFGVTLINSLCVEAPTPLLPHDGPPGQTNAVAPPEHGYRVRRRSNKKATAP